MDRSTTLVAQGDDGLLDGFACFQILEQDGLLLHYVYVRLSARGKGVARSMIEPFAPLLVIYTHRSRSLDSRRIPKRWQFDPYAAY